MGWSVSSLKMIGWGLFSGSVVKNSPDNAGDTGSIPDLGEREHVSEKIPHALEQLSPCATTTESVEPKIHNYSAHALQLLKSEHLEPVLRDKRSCHNEKSMHLN